VHDASANLRASAPLVNSAPFLPLLRTAILIALVSATPLVAHAQFTAASKAVSIGVQKRVYPGAVLIIGDRDSTLFAQGYGHFTWDPSSPRPRPDSTIWDLASLTKVIATTGVAARLVDQGRLDLEAPVSKYLPIFTGGGRESVTVRMLLDHTSGLPAWLALWREAPSASQAIARIAREPLRRRPGTSPVYSDLNAILLGAVLEKAGGAPFPALVEQEVIKPLGLTRTAFFIAVEDRGFTAPTSRDPGMVVRGRVNDLNAFFLGGASGHAGLFSSGHDVARVARAWLRNGELDGTRWLSEATVARFLERRPASGTRLLGWDTPDTTMTNPSSFGTHPGPAVYGHTGWTGTQMWIDPATGRFVVFLTNRAFEPRGRTFDRMREVRTAVADGLNGQ